jgi:hypothetical protein
VVHAVSARLEDDPEAGNQLAGVRGVMADDELGLLEGDGMAVR